MKHVGLVTVILAAICMTSWAQTAADSEARIKRLESEIEGLKARMTAMEVTSKSREAELAERVNDLEAAYTRSLERIADLTGENPEQLGYAIPEDAVKFIAILNNPKAEAREKDHALVSIATLGKEGIGAVPNVIDVLRKEKNSGLRCRAATTLGGICSASSGPLVGKGIRALQNARNNDTDPKVRELAQAALISILR